MPLACETCETLVITISVPGIAKLRKDVFVLCLGLGRLIIENSPIVGLESNRAPVIYQNLLIDVVVGVQSLLPVKVCAD